MSEQEMTPATEEEEFFIEELSDEALDRAEGGVLATVFTSSKSYPTRRYSDRCEGMVAPPFFVGGL
jgi:hypothetical protein